MDLIDSQAIRIPETDAAGAKSEPENPVQVSTFSSEILILSFKRSSISITAESKNSTRCIDLDALTLDVSGELKGVDSLSQPRKKEGSRKSNEGNFQDSIQVQLITAPHSHVPLEVTCCNDQILVGAMVLAHTVDEEVQGVAKGDHEDQNGGRNFNYHRDVQGECC